MGMPQNHNENILMTQLGHDSTPHDLSTLGNVFTEEEITKTVFALSKEKSIGPERFPAEFYL
jgi:hypothetical protein